MNNREGAILRVSGGAAPVKWLLRTSAKRMAANTLALLLSAAMHGWLRTVAYAR
jgi:hypothetical protein